MASQFMAFAVIMVLVAGSVSAQAPASSPKVAPLPKASSSPVVSPVAASSPKASTVGSPKASSGPVSAAAPATVSDSPAFASEGDYSSPPAPEDFEEGPAAGPVEGPIAADVPTTPVDAPAAAPSKNAAAALELSAAVSVIAVAGFFFL